MVGEILPQAWLDDHLFTSDVADVFVLPGGLLKRLRHQRSLRRRIKDKQDQVADLEADLKAKIMEQEDLFVDQKRLAKKIERVASKPDSEHDPELRALDTEEKQLNRDIRVKESEVTDARLAVTKNRNDLRLLQKVERGTIRSAEQARRFETGADGTNTDDARGMFRESEPTHTRFNPATSADDATNGSDDDNTEE